MSVTLYEPALEALLDSSEGLVGQFIRTKTDKIADDLARAAGDYYGGASALRAILAPDVGVDMSGSTGVISVTPTGSGRKWRRLIAMAANGTWREGPSKILAENHF